MTTRKRKEGSADPQGDEFVTLTIGPFSELKVPRAVHWAVEHGYLVTRDWLKVTRDDDGNVTDVGKAGEPGWNTKRNTDDHRASVLLRASRRDPGDLWALRTGSVSGVGVLDADDDGGLATLARLGLQPTYTTPGHGGHVLFSAPGRQLPTAGYDAAGRLPGVEVKGDGAKATFYGVNPYEDGRAYTFTSWPPKVYGWDELPDEVRDYIDSLPLTSAGEGEAGWANAAPVNDEWVEAKLRQALDVKVDEEGSRNKAGFWFLMRLWNQGMSKDDARPWALRFQAEAEPLRPGAYGVDAITDTLNSVWNRNPDERSPESYSNRTVRMTELPGPLPSGAVLPAGYREPAGYRIGQSIERMNVKGDFVELAPAPVLILERAVNGDGEETLRLAWWRAGQWRDQWFERADVLTGTKLVTLAQYGLPLTSGSATQMARFLLDIEAANLDRLPTQRFTRQLGWLSETHDDFYYGHDRNDVVFKMDGARHSSLDAFRTAGSADVWREAINRLEHYPAAALGLWASFAAPMLGPLGVASFVLSFSGLTTTGKTTALKLGGSVWGNAYPDESGLSVLWDTTKVAIEQLAGARRGVPLWLDETQRVDRAATVEDIIYEVCSGQGRLRGARSGGLKPSLGWSTILVSTGEQPLTDFTQAGGTRARVVEHWGSPFGEGHKALVDSLLGTIQHNYGHAGPEWIRYVLAHRDAWPKWQAALDNYDAKLALEVVGDVARRRCRYVALLKLAARLAHEAGLVGWHPTDEFWLGLAADEAADSDDQMAAAFMAAYDHAVVNADKFWSKNATWRMEPHGGWLGRWSGEMQSGHNIWWMPGLLDEFLKRRGWQPGACRRAWADRDWITRKGDRRTVKKRLGADGKPVWVVEMRIDAVLAMQEEPDDDPFA